MRALRPALLHGRSRPRAQPTSSTLLFADIEHVTGTQLISPLAPPPGYGVRMAWFKRRARRGSGADNMYPYSSTSGSSDNDDDGFRAGDVAASSGGGFLSGFFGGGDSGGSGESGRGNSSGGGGGDSGGGGGGGD